MGQVANAVRTRWSAVGAAVAVTLGAGGLATTSALVGSGERAIYRPIEPCRLLDTRPEFPPNQRTEPIGPQEYYDIGVRSAVGQCGDLFDGATGLSLNVTAINHTADTFLTLFPEDQAPNASTPPPNVSQLNPSTASGSGVPVPNAVQVDLDDDGEFTVYNQFGSVDVIIDVVGFFEDHHHDDRYYTKPQVDAAIENVYEEATAAGKFLSIDPLTVTRLFGATVSGYALRFPDSGTPGANLSVSVPIDFSPGSPLLLRLVWNTYTTDCDVSLIVGSVSRFRPGEAEEASSALDAFTVQAGPELYVSHEAILPVPAPGEGFAAGDAVNFHFLRYSSDTCSSMVEVTGIGILYS